jgi:hypothetical protein
MPGHENVEATAAVAGEVAVFAGTGCADGWRGTHGLLQLKGDGSPEEFVIPSAAPALRSESDKRRNQQFVVIANRPDGWVSAWCGERAESARQRTERGWTDVWNCP